MPPSPGGRGLVHGASLVSLINTAALIFALVAPMWFIERLELGESQCWHGDGIFYSRYWWGSLSHCKDPLDIGMISTSSAYCAGRVTPLPGDDANYNHDMCDSTRRAKVISVMAIVCSFLATLSGLIMGHSSNIRRHHEWSLAAVGAGSGFLSGILAFAASWIWMDSPLFSHEHLAVLSTFQRGHAYSGINSCSFQTPVASVFTLLSPSGQKCVFLGPSALVMLTCLIMSGISVALFAIMLRNHTGGWSITRDDKPVGKVYSMYGASERRFSHLVRWQRFLITTMVPLCFMLASAVSWAIFVQLGLPVVATVTVSISEMSELSPETLIVSEVSQSSAQDLFGTLTKIRDAVMAQAIARSSRGDAIRPGIYFTDIVNLFNFSPLTSISFFWEGGAHLIAVISFGAIFVVPISRVILWIWFFYAPMTEKLRGRVLSWVDSVGKYILAMIFIVQSMGVALCFDRVIAIPGWVLPPGSIPQGFGIVVDIHSGIGAGLGAAMYVCTALLQLIIGQSMVICHHFVSTWEGQRRARRLFGSTGNLNAEGTEDLFDARSPLADFNSPIGVSPLQGASQPMLRANRRSVIDALVSFGSSANLSTSAAAAAPPPSSSVALVEHIPLLRLAGLPQSLNSFAGVAGLAPPLHPAVEALCDRVHSPVQGVRLRWTPVGKVVLWLLLFLYVGLLLVLQSLPIFSVRLMGVNGKVIQLPEDAYREFSFISFFFVSNTISTDGSPIYGALFLLFTAIFPVVEAFLALVLWTIEMTISQQKFIFYTMELLAAWSCLDVFILSVLGMRFELEIALNQLGDFTVPQLAELVETLLPFKSLIAAQLRLLPFGFGIFFVTVLFEKLLLFALMEQALVAISEREAEVVLRSLAMDGGDGASVLVQSNAPNSGSHVIEDAAEGLLEHDSSAMFSPAARYLSSYFPSSVYSGLPRSWWVRYFVRFGFMADAKVVQRYYELGSWEAAMEHRPPPVLGSVYESYAPTPATPRGGGPVEF